MGIVLKCNNKMTDYDVVQRFNIDGNSNIICRIYLNKKVKNFNLPELTNKTHR